MIDIKLQNIDRLMLFREEAAGQVLTLEQLNVRYNIDPDGTNYYYGLNKANADNLRQHNTSFNASHKAFFDALLASLKASPDDEKTLVLGVEPLEAPDPYGFVGSNMALVTQLAGDLADVQSQARAAAKRLNIVVRYASEMNDTEQIQGKSVDGYRSTFVQVRLAFASVAPTILFSFSPALRADLPESKITHYWPGDDYVDIVGGTWYIGAAEQRPAAISTMRKYFLHRVGASKPFALSEVGGCSAGNTGNDAVLQEMLHELEAFQLQDISFKYVTLFLASKYGSDATLSFLRT